MKEVSPRTWPSKSIAIYCTLNLEAWGPENISRGIGGSEEAIIYLSRELAKMGWDITVFCERTEDLEDIIPQSIKANKKIKYHAVKYRSWRQFNTHDIYDVLIAWRKPPRPGIKARIKIVDVHDVLPETVLINEINNIDKIMVKSIWQRNFYSNISDSKFAVIGNGIVKEQFMGNKKKRKYSAGYFSSYDRGLYVLLDMWPKIRKEIPDATLDIYYGWNIFDKTLASNLDMARLKSEIIRSLNELKSLGVREHGRVSHQELARAMKEISVWLYPTEYTEIHCITALKTAEAEMHQVHTGVGALMDTAPNATVVRGNKIYTDREQQKEFIRAAAAALKHPVPSKPPKGRYWLDVARAWDKVLNE